MSASPDCADRGVLNFPGCSRIRALADVVDGAQPHLDVGLGHRARPGEVPGIVDLRGEHRLRRAADNSRRAVVPFLRVVARGEVVRPLPHAKALWPPGPGRSDALARSSPDPRRIGTYGDVAAQAAGVELLADLGDRRAAGAAPDEGARMAIWLVPNSRYLSGEGVGCWPPIVRRAGPTGAKDVDRRRRLREHDRCSMMVIGGGDRLARTRRRRGRRDSEEAESPRVSNAGKRAQFFLGA